MEERNPEKRDLGEDELINTREKVNKVFDKEEVTGCPALSAIYIRVMSDHYSGKGTDNET